MLLGFCDSHAYQVRMACVRRIGICGYMSAPEDWSTCCILLSKIIFLLRYLFVSLMFPHVGLVICWFIGGGWPWQILGTMHAVASIWEAGEIFGPVNNTWFYICNISQNLNTTTNVDWWGGENVWNLKKQKFYCKGSRLWFACDVGRYINSFWLIDWLKKRKNSLTNF